MTAKTPPTTPQGLPASAHSRLARARTGGYFSTTFSAAELLLIRDQGMEPLGQVLGVSVFQTGGQWTSGGWRDSDRKKAATQGLSYELTTATRAFYEARHIAMQRMREEAIQLGADLVLGARIERQIRNDDPHNGPTITEFRACGTALRTVKHHPAKIEPVLSNLTATEYLQLREGGYRPLGIVTGNCNWLHIASQKTSFLVQSGFWSRQGRVTQELPDLTHAIYQTRELAMNRLDHEAKALGASGVLGVEIESDHDSHHESQQSQANIGYLGVPVAFQFFALGTAVAGSATKIHSVGNSAVRLES